MRRCAASARATTGRSMRSTTAWPSSRRWRASRWSPGSTRTRRSRASSQCRPERLVKGGDWSADKIVGAAEVKGWGGTVHSIAFRHDRSTTNAALAKIRAMNDRADRAPRRRLRAIVGASAAWSRRGGASALRGRLARRSTTAVPPRVVRPARTDEVVARGGAPRRAGASPSSRRAATRACAAPRVPDESGTPGDREPLAHEPRARRSTPPTTP